MPISAQFNRPFPEQVTFFRNKLNLPTTRSGQITRDQNDAAFVVAGATKADLLADLRGAVDDAISNGQSLGEFRKQFEEIVAKRGWTGWTGEGSKAGRAWRTRLIYKTNLDTSYAAGRWQQMTDPDVVRLRPYWRYIHNTIENPRQQHQRWNNLVLRHDHPWWQAHYPPNGWGCNCGVETLNERGLRRLGKEGPDAAPNDGTYESVDNTTGEVVTVPNGIQPGWDYAPGQTATERAIAARLNRLDNVEATIARQNVADLVQAPLFSRFFNGEIQGEYPVAVVPPLERQVLGAESPVVLLSQQSLRTHLERHPEIGLDDYRRVQQLLDDGQVYQLPDQPGRLIYLVIEGVTYRAALKRTQDGKKSYFLTLFKSRTDQPPPQAERLR
ncbi:phage minor head protein [Vreelandella hamiltonii]|uniref:Virion morphogenesis protein n=1 Tax=Vreelandella hamiltonii TaxID=502829 RepID=A0A8H9LZC1_9GAMM|nr:phage minor head protein [Halomonas hamiltonii]GGW23681.1 virion morphogenesis protein [Halomonas hamiltonii]